ncbi:MAG: hypothetical protein NTZ28_02180, partial [Nitrospirae bacterium]|nr:hypothetical protein [Nitrospirota bacterium]
GVTMDGKVSHSHLVRLGLPGFIVVLGLSLVGCPQPIPRVPIPGSDASPPTMARQTYNMQTKESGEILKDGQSIDLPSSDQYVVTLAVEDLNSGVKDVTLSGNVHYACEQGGRVEDKKFPLETQETKPTPDQENTVPVRASLVYAVEFGKMGCKENWMFGGGKLSLVGKAHNFVGGAEMRTLHFNLKKQPSQ